MKPDFIDILNDSHIQYLVSPLHKDDLQPNGETKKEHYHIMILYDSPHTQEQAQAIFDSIGAVKCQAVNSTRGQARYLCHLDSPDKAQYSPSEVICGNGIDYMTLIALSSDKYGVIREIIQFIETNDVRSFSTLVMWCSDNNEQWFRHLCDDCTYIIKEYLQSRVWTQRCKVDDSITADDPN